MAIIIPFFGTPILCIIALIYWQEILAFCYFVSNLSVLVMIGASVLYAGYFWVALQGDILNMDDDDVENDLLIPLCVFGIIAMWLLVLGSNWGHPERGLFRILGDLLYFFTFIMGGPIIIVGVLMASATIIPGLIGIFTTHPAERNVKRQLATRRPSSVVEKELASTLRNHHADLKEVRALIGELPMHMRWAYKIRYRALSRKQNSMNKTLDAQRDVMWGDQDLGLKTHDLERAKRDAAEPDPAERFMKGIKKD